MELENCKIAIIGLGYVGLPLAVEFGKRYSVIGYDINELRIQELKLGYDKTLESNSSEITASKHLKFSTESDDLKSCNVYIVTVPTPIDEFKSPDLKPLLKASEMIGSVLNRGDIVIYESTVYPGCTEEDCVPVLEKSSNLKFNIDFYCGYSPERINPGDKINTLTKIKKVTSGSTPIIGDFINRLYQSIILAGTHLAPSIKVAEASKAIENAQRDVNISFVNELALIFDRMGIDTQDVLDAAGTKWNFLKFQPGLVGGHCIGVDPYYLAHKAQSLGYHPEVILSGRRVNDYMGTFVANQVIKLMIGNEIPIKGSRALVLGATFKENCPDTRNSKIVDIVNELISFGVEVSVFDPFVKSDESNKEFNYTLTNKLDRYDCIILAVRHNAFLELDFFKLKKSENAIIYDLKAYLPRNYVNGRL
jgi:UDP-N-acetyl-D-galactosamine dehydrogenase